MPSARQHTLPSKEAANEMEDGEAKVRTIGETREHGAKAIGTKAATTKEKERKAGGARERAKVKSQP